MLCPLTFIRGDSDGAMPCGEGNCAWWDTYYSECVVRSLGIVLNEIQCAATDYDEKGRLKDGVRIVNVGEMEE